jgi:hypothetical protein
MTKKYKTLSDVPAELIKEYMVEAEAEGTPGEGWSSKEVPMFKKLFKDMLLYANNAE